jgi:phage shock protein E
MKKMLTALMGFGLVFGLVLSSFSAESAKPLIIDVRTEAEWDSGHIEGAILIPYKQIGEKIGTIAREKSKRLYVYCRTGRRSQAAKETLDKLGYKDIINLGALENAAKAMKLKIVK